MVSQHKVDPRPCLPRVHLEPFGNPDKMDIGTSTTFDKDEELPPGKKRQREELEQEVTHKKVLREEFVPIYKVTERQVYKKPKHNTITLHLLNTRDKIKYQNLLRLILNHRSKTQTPSFYCNKRFSTKQSLKRHTSTLHLLAPQRHHCPACDRTFTRRDNNAKTLLKFNHI